MKHLHIYAFICVLFALLNCGKGAGTFVASGKQRMLGQVFQAAAAVYYPLRDPNYHRLEIEFWQEADECTASAQPKSYFLVEVSNADSASFVGNYSFLYGAALGGNIWADVHAFPVNAASADEAPGQIGSANITLDQSATSGLLKGAIDYADDRNSHLVGTFTAVRCPLGNRH